MKGRVMFYKIGSWILNNVILTSAVVIFSLMLTLIASNALWYQSSPHSSPMFNTRTADTDTSMVTNGINKANSNNVKRPTKAAPQYDRELVLELQRGLAKHGLYKSSIDGLMGKNTQAAIIAFQNRYGMKITGDVSVKLLSQVLQTEPAANRPKLAKVEVPSRIDNAVQKPIEPDWASYKVIPKPRPNVVRASQPTEKVETLVPVQQVATVPVKRKTKPAVVTAAPVEKVIKKSIGDIVETVASDVVKPSNNLNQNYNLQGGITKPLIIKIQQGLKNYGIADIKVDGKLNEKTTTGIRYFQYNNNLEIDGVPSPKLLQKMKEFGTFNG
jgi:peptidoglycan hydrolase-like protein with peptidoglycan-binding domain